MIYIKTFVPIYMMISMDPRPNSSAKSVGSVVLLKELDSPGVKQAALARKFGVSISQVSRLAKAKEEILEQFESGLQS